MCDCGRRPVTVTDERGPGCAGQQHDVVVAGRARDALHEDVAEVLGIRATRGRGEVDDLLVDRPPGRSTSLSV